MRVLLRWVSFIPISAGVIAFAQAGTAFVAGQFRWWVAAAVILFFGGVILGAVAWAISIAPNPKIGATIMLTLFTFLEIMALLAFVPGNAVFPIAVRIYTDVVVILGAVGGAIIARTESPSRPGSHHLHDA